jgi:hypothetical protein
MIELIKELNTYYSRLNVMSACSIYKRRKKSIGVVEYYYCHLQPPLTYFLLVVGVSVFLYKYE